MLQQRNWWNGGLCMNLNNNTEEFIELVTAASNILHIPPNVIEKDYYVTRVLKELSKSIDGLVFKGGTSLTKCYQILDRFSEDIDLSYSLHEGAITESKRKKLKKSIVDTMDRMQMKILNLDETRSRRNYNRFRCQYYSIYEKSTVLKPEIVIETYVALLPYPTLKRPVDNYLYRFLKEVRRDDLIEMYDLQLFEMETQAIERTLIDKIFALCDYYLNNEVHGHSRHIYDIYKIIEAYGITDEMRTLFPIVKEARRKIDICTSAKENLDLKSVLQSIVVKEVFKQDYIDITSELLFSPVSYESAVTGLERIVQSDLFG